MRYARLQDTEFKILIVDIATLCAMRSPEAMEIHTLAQQASETSPLDALRILERAQLSGRFRDRNKSFANLS